MDQSIKGQLYCRLLLLRVYNKILILEVFWAVVVFILVPTLIFESYNLLIKDL